MKKKIKKDKFRFIVEVPANLHDRLQTEAQNERRSRNAQVIRVLEERYSTGVNTPIALAK